MLDNALNIEFKKKLEKYNLLDSKLVIAVSGGVDSMVLLDLCLKFLSKDNLHIVHFDHGIRKESDLDAELIKIFLQKSNFDLNNFFVYKLNFDSDSNFEAQARTKRYNMLNNHLLENNFDLILTAHHQDDQIETVLLNFLKGSFVDGLAGIADYDKNRKLFRPLLNLNKVQIYKYAEKFKIPFNEDQTNFDTKYLRNYLRNSLIPDLTKKLGSLSVLARNSVFFKELSEFLDVQIQQFIKSNVTVKNKITIVKVANLKDLPSFMRFRFYSMFINDYTLSVPDFYELDHLVLNGVTGKYRQLGVIQFLIQKKELHIVLCNS